MSRASAVCADCNGAPLHAITWLSNSSDVLALSFASLRANPVTLFLAAIGEWVLDRITGILFAIGRLLGVFTLHADLSRARNERSRMMWREALARGIPMRQVYAFGTPLELYEIEVRGKKRITDGMPLPSVVEALHIDDKISFKRLMRENGLPAPRSESVFSFGRAKALLSEFSCICVKPRSGSNGLHTYPFVRTEEQLTSAFSGAKQLCFLLSIEEHLEGNLCRATCVNGKLVGFLESAYPTVTGDGTSTIAELVARKNAAREEGVEEVELTSSHLGYIDRRGYSPESVLPEGVTLPLTYRAGGGCGGGNREHGRDIHPSFIPLLEKAAQLTELPVVGFDLIIPDPQAPADSQRWGFIEANSFPWINLHASPLAGAPVNIATHLWDLWD